MAKKIRIPFGNDLPISFKLAAKNLDGTITPIRTSDVQNLIVKYGSSVPAQATQIDYTSDENFIYVFLDSTILKRGATYSFYISGYRNGLDFSLNFINVIEVVTDNDDANYLDFVIDMQQVEYGGFFIGLKNYDETIRPYIEDAERATANANSSAENANTAAANANASAENANRSAENAQEAAEKAQFAKEAADAATDAAQSAANAATLAKQAAYDAATAANSAASAANSAADNANKNAELAQVAADATNAAISAAETATHAANSATNAANAATHAATDGAENANSKATLADTAAQAANSSAQAAQAAKTAADAATISAQNAAAHAEEAASTIDSKLGDLQSQITELGENIDGYSLDFQTTAGDYIYTSVGIDIKPSSVLYVKVDAQAKFISIYGKNTNDENVALYSNWVPSKWLKVDGSNIKNVYLYADKKWVIGSGDAKLSILTGLSAAVKDIEQEGDIHKTENIVPAVKYADSYISTSLSIISYSLYDIYEPIHLLKGETIFTKGNANSGIALLTKCNKECTEFYEMIQSGGDNNIKTFTAQEDLYLCICMVKSSKKDVLVSRRLESIFAPISDILEIDNRVVKLEEIGVTTSEVFNLFDASKATVGYYVNINGNLVADETHVVSDFIPIEFGKTYSMPVDPDLFGVNNAKSICMYDSTKNFIGICIGTLNGIINTIVIDNATAKYIRTTALARSDSRYKYKFGQSYDTYMVVNAAKYPNRYYPYGELVSFKDYELSAETNALINPLFGKSVVFDGDSICNARGDTNMLGWAGRIGNKNRMLWQNYAIGGGTFTNGGWGTHVISAQSYDDADPDYIIIEGGTNDADRIGSILGDTKPSAYGSYAMTGYTDDYANTTYCGAIEYLFKRLLSTYPKAKIGVIIAQKMGVSQDYTPSGNNRRAYFETLMNLCKKWGIPYINLWDEGRLNPILSAHYTKGEPNSLYVDGQHLTPNGYDVITPMIEEWMKTL